MHKLGFVIGNGESRLKYDLSILREQGLIYGCNALYKDFEPDLLISVDANMVKKILKSDYKGEVLYIGIGTRKFFLNRSHPENKPGMENFVINSRGFAAGPSAVWLMIHYFPNIKIINLIGFDLYGKNGKINNVYAGKDDCYQPADSNAVVFRSWVEHLAIIFKENPGVQFFRVGNMEDSVPEDWQDISNIQFSHEWVKEIGEDKVAVYGGDV